MLYISHISLIGKHSVPLIIIYNTPTLKIPLQAFTYVKHQQKYSNSCPIYHYTIFEFWLYTSKEYYSIYIKKGLYRADRREQKEF